MTMKAIEADLIVLDNTLTWIAEQIKKADDKNTPKIARAYLRLFERLQKVYIRVDNKANKTEGNS